MKPKIHTGIFALAIILLAPMLVSSVSHAQDATIMKSMAALKDETAQLGAPKIEGKDPVGGKDAPALYFGSTKMNNNFTIVNKVGKESDIPMGVTLFVKGGDDEYISVATNVPKADKSGPAIGTVFPKGEGLDAIEAGKPSYGEVAGGKYVFGSEPIRDASGAVLGIYSVGYLK